MEHYVKFFKALLSNVLRFGILALVVVGLLMLNEFAVRVFGLSQGIMPLALVAIGVVLASWFDAKKP